MFLCGWIRGCIIIIFIFIFGPAREGVGIFVFVVGKVYSKVRYFTLLFWGELGRWSRGGMDGRDECDGCAVGEWGFWVCDGYGCVIGKMKMGEGGFLDFCC